MDPKFTLFGNFWVQCTPRKLNIMLKTKFFAKSAALGLTKNISLKPQKNQKNSGKVAKKINIFKAQNGSKLPLGSKGQRVNKNSHIVTS